MSAYWSWTCLGQVGDETIDKQQTTMKQQSTSQQQSTNQQRPPRRRRRRRRRRQQLTTINEQEWNTRQLLTVYHCVKIVVCILLLLGCVCCCLLGLMYALRIAWADGIHDTFAKKAQVTGKPEQSPTRGRILKAKQQKHQNKPGSGNIKKPHELHPLFEITLLIITDLDHQLNLLKQTKLGNSDFVQSAVNKSSWDLD